MLLLRVFFCFLTSLHLHLFQSIEYRTLAVPFSGSLSVPPLSLFLSRPTPSPRLYDCTMPYEDRCMYSVCRVAVAVYVQQLTKQNSREVPVSQSTRLPELFLSSPPPETLQSSASSSLSSSSVVCRRGKKSRSNQKVESPRLPLSFL